MLGDANNTELTSQIIIFKAILCYSALKSYPSTLSARCLPSLLTDRMEVSHPRWSKQSSGSSSKTIAILEEVMLSFNRGRLIASALFLFSGLLVVVSERTAVSATILQKEKKDKDRKDKDVKDLKDGGGKAAKDLRKAFDTITDLSQTSLSGKEATRVFDHAKRIYREAVKSYPDDPRRSAELAAAANDTARGLEHLNRALAKPVAGLPEPPADFDRPFGGPKGKGPPAWNAGAGAETGPWSESLEALSVAREQLGNVEPGTPVTGPSRDILDAAKAVYAQARTAYEAAEYRKAAELARASEALSHVPEHLSRAGWETGIAPPAPPLGPVPRPKGSGVPPPPPAIQE
jgi:hypothetical protein